MNVFGTVLLYTAHSYLLLFLKSCLEFPRLAESGPHGFRIFFFMASSMFFPAGSGGGAIWLFPLESGAPFQSTEGECNYLDA